MDKQVVQTGSASAKMLSVAAAFQPPLGPGKLIVFVYAASVRLHVSDEEVILPVQAEESG